MKPLTDLIIGGQKLMSRLFVGTGKFASPEVMAGAVEASGTELVTVALRQPAVSRSLGVVVKRGLPLSLAAEDLLRIIRRTLRSRP